MKSFAIVTDNGCALTKPLRERFHIDGVVYGTIAYPDGRIETADLDYERTTPEEYFTSMTKKSIYKTACANLDQIKDMLEPFAKEGKDILFITISSALSGTYNFGLKAAELLMNAYPGVKIEVVDSLRYSTALGMMLIEASALREQGKSFDETVAWVREHRACFHQMGIMDDLYFLARTGRVAKAAAFFGTMIGVEPMAEFSSSGLSEVLCKAKGKKKALLATVGYIKDRVIDPQDHILFVCHSLREKEATFLKEEIEKQINPKEIIVSYVDQTCGANIGPGLCAAFFFGKKITDDLEEERNLLNSLVA